MKSTSTCIALTAILITQVFVFAARTDAQHVVTSPRAKQTESADTAESAAKSTSATDEATASAETTKADKDGEDKQPTKKATEKKPVKKKARKTHEVTSGAFRVEVELSGIFVAEEMKEIALRPEAWSEFKIKEIVEHGSEVHEGQILAKFDNRKIDEAIATLDLELHLSDLAIRRAEEELPQKEKTLEMALSDAERRARLAREDYDRFKELEQSFLEKFVDYTVKGSEFDLTYAIEELQQLEKMYAADDLTEETEEIVLKRQRNTVDMARFSVEDAEFFRDGALKITLPRMESRLKDAVESSEIDLARAKMALSIDMNRARYELEKMKRLQDKSRERHAKLLSDRNLMEISSSASGVVYYGSCTHGRWGEMTSLISKLRPYGNASPNSVLMTIVGPRPLFVTAAVKESDYPALAVGQMAKVVPPPEHARKLDAEVVDISNAPISSVSSRRFGADLQLTGEGQPEWLVAGMTCKILVTTYEQDEALTVPSKAVHSDEDDDEREFVWVVDAQSEEADAIRRDVVIGQRNDDDVEVLEGLQAGEIVSLEDESNDDE